VETFDKETGEVEEGAEREMKANEFKCEICGGIFEKALSENEAQKQLGEEFPGFKSDDCGLVCQDCYDGTRKVPRKGVPK
jgi:Fe2+ or Zn2+ uptake regulation protein